MSLNQLSAIVPKPLKPTDVGDIRRWIDVEKEIGTHLPGDYKDFINAYGTGSFDDFLYVFNPFTNNHYLNLLNQKEVMLNAYRTLRAEFPKKYPFSTYPDREGLLPWGITDNGDELYWLTNGDNPDQWKVVTFKAGDSYYELHNFTLTGYLAQLLGNRLETRLYPDEFRKNQNRYYTSFAE